MTNFFKAAAFMMKFVHSNNIKWIFLTTLKNIFIAIISITTIIAPKHIVDELVNRQRIDRLFCTVLIYAGIVTICSLLNIFLSRSIYIQKDKLTQKFDIMLCEITMKIDYKYLETPEYFDLKNRASQIDFSQYCSVLEGFFTVIRHSVVIISVCTILTTLSPLILILIALIVIFNGIANSRNNKNDYKFQSLLVPIDRKMFHFTTLLSDFLYGKEIRSNHMAPFIMCKYKENADEAVGVLNQWLSFSNKASYLRNFTEFAQLIAVYGYLVFEVIKNGMTIGNFTMCFAAVTEFSAALNGIVTEFQRITKTGLHIEDLKKIMAIAQQPESKKGNAIPPLDTVVFEFVNVGFKYHGCDEYALKDVNIKICANQKLSIVGMNGAGKTTFVKLLMRLYEPTDGKILLNGIDISILDLSEYYLIFSVVFQDFKLFAMSLLDNILLSNEENTTEVAAAISKSGLNEMVGALPDGISTSIYKIFDETGIEPSGGEGQKIAIARAIYKDAPVVIMDEPTAALDPLAEYEVYRSFNKLVGEKTAIYISHRLSSTRFCDKIAVFDDGKIVEYGSHDELMQNEGLYHEMFEKQATFYVDSKAVI